MVQFNNQPMLNVYPDSLGGHLKGTVDFLSSEQAKGCFQSVYLLPSVFHTDLDRGFSVIDYHLNRELVKSDDFTSLAELGIKTKLDFILNHASVLSSQFQSIIKEGTNSPYYDFFIDWNKFWQGHGEMTEAGYIQPYSEYLNKMFFRKPGLPILQILTETNERLTFWNTFYQEKKYPALTTQQWMKQLDCQYYEAEQIANSVREYLAGHEDLSELDLGSLNHNIVSVKQTLEQRCEYLGQMDLNIQSPLVWDFYRQTLDQLKSYGASIVRLDAFAYAPKKIGERNFLNDPGTWDLLEKVNQLAIERQLTLLPEIHESYEEKIHERISGEGYLIYDFFLPGLILDAIEGQNAEHLIQWFNDIQEKNMKTVNMLGCHDGIPLLDLKGLLPEERIVELINTVVDRGGYVKNLHGQKNVYYQVNATYFSALGEDAAKMILARAMQLFMPGKPQIWYLDVFAGRNDHDAVRRAGAGGHKEINRTNLTSEQMEEAVLTKVVQDQLRLIRFRNQFDAFNPVAEVSVTHTGTNLEMSWQFEGSIAKMSVDLKNPGSLTVIGQDMTGNTVFNYQYK